ncbi:unnamed protein product [Adineta steineri]|uniref:Uncharacterized protein n=1 Tax=Adineta steineri TaxID=433720 RepID=A0A818W8R4_9BILA|nr:unnamed protein product [Adineta steineri]CAF3721978.1 unnamed protein product [Adineta steineri]
MGNKPLQTYRKKEPSLRGTYRADSEVVKVTSSPSFSLASGTATFSCLAAEHHQIHDQETLDHWRAKALQTIDDLYEQKASFLRREAHVRTLVGQLRAFMDDELPRHGSGYFVDDQHVQQLHMSVNSSQA